MQNKLMALAVLAFLLVSAFGCAPIVPAEGGTEISSDISMLDDLDAELDMSELDDLEQEFAEIETLFS